MKNNTREQLTTNNIDILLEISPDQIQNKYLIAFEDNIPFWDRLMKEQSKVFDTENLFLSGECFCL